METHLDQGDPHFRWHNYILPEPIPLDAQALNQESIDQLVAWYPNEIHRLHAPAPPAVIRPPPG